MYRREISFQKVWKCLFPLLFVSFCGAEEPEPVDPEALAFFNHEVHPVLEANCFKCHGGGEKIKGGLRLTSQADLLRGGDLGPAYNATAPRDSLLLKMISYDDPDHEMPPKGKLSPEKISILTRWITSGAVYDPEKEIHVKRSTEDDPTRVNAKSKNYWAFKPVVRPPVPTVSDPKWRENPIDAFVWSQLQANELHPNPRATREELIRRASMDLTGLPPTPEQVAAFSADKSGDAWPRLVDSLLESPHYGEKWGRHWLDLVRFAESNGYERDSPKPMAWTYRDYVIRAFNENKPYDRFLMEQLAGDELQDANADSVTATGYHRLGLWDDEPVDRELARYDYLDSIVATTGEVMLGLTVGCARCHDHKIDPFPSADYYRMLAFFANISPHGKGKANLVTVKGSPPNHYSEPVDDARARSNALRDQRRIEEEFVSKSKDRKLATLRSPLGDLRFRFYRNTWETLPDFDQINPETEGVVDGRFLDFANASRLEAMGMVYEGRFWGEKHGEYEFVVKAKDGVRLQINNITLLEHRGPGEKTVRARVKLPGHPVPFRLDYYHRTGKPVLEVTVRGPDQRTVSLVHHGSPAPRVLLADARLGGETWSYTKTKPDVDWVGLDCQPEGWKAGGAGFGKPGTPGTVVRTEWKGPDIWLRKEFEVKDAPEQLVLRVHHDEDAEIYINGTKVAGFVGPRGSYMEQRLDVSGKELLREGRNVIAVQARQTKGGSYIDVGLASGFTKDPGLILTQSARGVIDDKSYDRYIRLLQQKQTAGSNAKAEYQVMAVAESGRHTVHVLNRGNPRLKGDEVSPGFPSVLSPSEPKIKDLGESSGRRLALARWVVDPKNPLTARVMVNRIWHYHFGRGIVRSTSNFGRLGDPPTHPRLLDWLASEFVEKNWDVKAMHRLIMTSRTYQMSSQDQVAGLEKDPNNDLFWRFDVRRLTAEEVRDSMLAATGELNRKAGGPSFYRDLPREVLATSSTGAGKWGKSDAKEQARRSVYQFVRRSLLDPMLTAFDSADTDNSCPVRFATIVPTQALTMLNSKFVNDRAFRLAERLRKESESLPDQVRRGLELCSSRPATEEEVNSGLEFISQLQKNHRLTEEKALERFCLLALNLNEFMFVK